MSDVNHPNQETLEILKESVMEIKELRAANEKMSLRLQMFDDIKCLLQSKSVPKNNGITFDIIDDIEEIWSC